METNKEETNRERDTTTCGAEHNAHKKQQIDVVGLIGTLTIEDTGDFRFANLFKQTDGTGKWLIENLVPSVNYKLPNKIASDIKDVRREVANEKTNYHGTYQKRTKKSS